MTTQQKSQPTLKRSMRLRDLVLLNVSCVVGLSSLAQVAQFGFASLTLLAFAFATFLVPCAIMVAELNARMPEEGGFYLWTRSAFGDRHGYLVAWCYWLSNIVWLPTVLLFFSVSCLYVFGDQALVYADHPWYIGMVCIGTLWIVTLLNIFGLEKAKWIQNLGGMAIWLCILFLVIFGLIYVSRFGSVHEFQASKLLPDFSDFAVLPFFAIVAFCFAGLELAPVMAGEVQHPRRNIPRAIVISSILICLIYMSGTLMLIFTVSEGDVGIIDGVAQSFHEVSKALENPVIRGLGAILVTLSTLGLFGAWLTGAARIPFVVGLDNYLPAALGRVHKRWGSPYVSLILQAVVLSLLLAASLYGSSVKEAYLVLLDMSIILYFIPFLYMFAALFWHVRKGTGQQGIFRFFEKPSWVLFLVTGLGFGITFLSIVLSCIPSGAVERPMWFVTKVVGGAGVLIGLGFVLYLRRMGHDQ